MVDGLSSGLGIGLGPSGLAVVEAKILEAVAGAKSAGRGVVLVLDGLDFLMAATGCGVLGVTDMVGELREVCWGVKKVCLYLRMQWLI